MTADTPAKRAHGGHRAGAGRPASTAGSNLTRENARLASERADRLQMQNQITRGAHVPRDAVRRASATALATLSQGLRMLPDTLERKFALPGEIVDGIAAAIDSALNDCADAFEKMAPK